MREWEWKGVDVDVIRPLGNCCPEGGRSTLRAALMQQSRDGYVARKRRLNIEMPKIFDAKGQRAVFESVSSVGFKPLKGRC